MTAIMITGGVIAGVLAGGWAGVFWSNSSAKGKVRESRRLAGEVLEEAARLKDARLKEAELEARETAFKIRVAAEEEAQLKKQEYTRRDQEYSIRETEIGQERQKLEQIRRDLDRTLEDLRAREKQLDIREREVSQALAQQHQKMEEISGLSLESARERLLKEAEELIRSDAARVAQKVEREFRENAVRKAREVMTLAIQRYANDHVAETSISVVPIQSEDVKGRIIGREGRNIRAFQQATGVDLIIDDTPDAIIVSGFDPHRREVARLALEKLLQDGRVHPARIEEVVEKIRRELDQTLLEEAEKVAFELGITDIHPEILKLVGRLKFRTSYGQNNLLHAREVAYLCSMMASELGLNPKLAKRAGFLHDIGKSLTHEGEGSHPLLGADAAKKYGESPEVVNAIQSHHGDVEPICLESILVAASDAISAARPGARRESMDAYIKRLEKLEGIANSFKGVEKSYAIQAGREIRIIVRQDEVSDEDLLVVSREIAKKIEAELKYPGQIKVTVIRENRIVEYAR